MEFKPVDWLTNPTKKYALLIYMGGTGEMFQQPGGTDQDLCPVLNYSMPWHMNNGNFPNTVTDNNTGQTFSYLVLMPFVRAWEEQYSVDPGAMIDYALQAYAGRIDIARIYLTGMSRGTDNLMGYITGSVYAASRIAAVVPVANCFPANVGNPWYDQQISHLAQGRVHIWGVSCANDKLCPEQYMQNWVSSLNSQRPGYAQFSYATFACDTEGPNATNHYAWNQTYDQAYTVNGMNIYQWMIQFSQNALVPVKLKDWRARVDAGKVLLEWTTTEEFNTKEFVIQRSTSTGSFEDLLRVPAAGSSGVEKKYSLVDDNPLPGASLYRLVLKNLDGKEEIFPIKSINILSRWTERVIIPNPVNDGLLSVYLNVQRGQRVSIRLFDLNGRMLRQLDRQLRAGISEHQLDVSSLQKGVYLVQIIGDDITTAKKITIE